MHALTLMCAHIAILMLMTTVKDTPAHTDVDQWPQCRVCMPHFSIYFSLRPISGFQFLTTGMSAAVLQIHSSDISKTQWPAP